MQKLSATINEAIEKLKTENKLSVQLFIHGSMQVKFYSPKNVDLQTPHKQDELYIISAGKGIFFYNGERINFSTGDVLFAAAGIEHRFENFTDDFATWVIFYGPDGGEKIAE
ncbi:MAG: cupin domain-containing protein [Chitinophagaceae bacterium]